MPDSKQIKNIHPINILLLIITSKWSLQVVAVLGSSTRRYNEIKKMLPAVTQKVLTETLRKLERNGIVERRMYSTIPPQVEYSLTPIGLDLLKLSGILSDWVDTHAEEIKRAQKSYDHRKKP